MQDLIIMAAKMMPEEELLKLLKEAIAEYELVPTDKNKNAVTMFVFMISIKFTTEGKDLVDIIKKADEVKKVSDLLNRTES